MLGSPDSAIQLSFLLDRSRVSDVWLTQSNDDDNVNSTPTLDRRHATDSRYILRM
jgi:hypothetical protein